MSRHPSRKAIAAMLAGPIPRWLGADFAPPTDGFTETAAERALWRCLGVVMLHQEKIGRLMNAGAGDAAIGAVWSRIDAELDTAAATVPDTRQAFALKALVVHKHGREGFPAGERVARALVADLMCGAVVS